MAANPTAPSPNCHIKFARLPPQRCKPEFLTHINMGPNHLAFRLANALQMGLADNTVSNSVIKITD